MNKSIVFVVLILSFLETVVAEVYADGLVCRSKDYIGSFDTPGSARDLVIVDTTAYIADRASGLTILDVSDPEHSFLIGSYNNMTAWALNVDVVENIAYVVTTDQGLQVIDVSDPGAPIFLGGYETITPMFDIKVVDSIAYIANWDDGLVILDVSVPSAPSLMSVVPTTGASQGLVVEDGLVYVADGSAGLKIVDVHDPSKPQVIGVDNTYGRAVGLDYAEGVVYLIDAILGFHIFDVADPTHPNYLSTVYASPRPGDIQVVGDRVYLTDRGFEFSKGIAVVDVNNPMQPVLLKDFLFTGKPFGIFMIGTMAYIAANENGLQIIDMSNSTSEILDTDSSMVDFWDIAINGNEAYLVGDGYGLLIYDISDPANLIQIGSLHSDSWDRLSEVQVAGNFVFLQGFFGSSYCIDISDPTSPQQVGAYSGAESRRFHVDNDLAYAAGAQLEIIDWSDPASPVLLSSISTESFATEIVVVESVAYVLEGSNGLEMFDVQDPLKPVFIGLAAFDVDFYAGFFVVDQIAFVGNDRSGMQIIDLHNPAQPVLLSQISTPRQAVDVVVVGSVAFVDDFSALIAIDVSDLSSPQFMSAMNIPGGAHHIQVKGDVAYLPLSLHGFVTVDISDCGSCPADLTGDGALDFFDVGDFLVAYAAEDSAADIDQNGEFNFFDVGDFLTAYAAGCP